MSGETVDKPKKARKPYVWTPQRKEAFERMRLKRDEKLKVKKETKEKGKKDVEDERKTLSELLKNTAKIKQILALIDEKHVHKVDPPKEPIPKKIPAIKTQIPSPQPQPEPEIESETEYEDDDESDEDNTPPPPPPPPTPNIPKQKQTFRYSTTFSKSNLPKPVVEPKPPPAQSQVVEKKKPTYLFL